MLKLWSFNCISIVHKPNMIEIVVLPKSVVQAFRNLNHVVLFSWHKLDRFVKFCHIFLVLVLKPKLVVWVMIKHLLKEQVFLLILPNICISSSTGPVLGFLFPCSNVLKLQILKIARNKYKILFYWIDKKRVKLRLISCFFEWP